MLRRIFLPLVIFCTILAAANVRSAPLLVLAIAEIIFAGLMIALALFQRSKLKLTPVNSFLRLQKGQLCECRIRVDNASPFPISRFILSLSHGYDAEDKTEEVLYGGTDKSEGFLKLTLDNDYCGINRLQLENVRCYDWFLLSSFSKKLDDTMQVAVLPDRQLKMTIRQGTPLIQTGISADEREFFRKSGEGGEPDDIRPYREGDPMRHIYWKQSAKMNELWVKEYKEELIPYPVVEIPVQKCAGLDKRSADDFYRVLYGLLAGLLESSEGILLRRPLSGGSFEDYIVREPEQLDSLLVCIYRDDFRAAGEMLTTEETAPELVLRVEPESLGIFKDGVLLKRFEAGVTDEDIRKTIIII